MILDHNAQIFAVIVETGFNPGKNRLPVLTQTMEYVACLSSLAFVVGISKVYSELILKQGSVRTVEVFCHPILRPCQHRQSSGYQREAVEKNGNNAQIDFVKNKARHIEHFEVKWRLH